MTRSKRRGRNAPATSSKVIDLTFSDDDDDDHPHMSNAPGLSRSAQADFLAHADQLPRRAAKGKSVIPREVVVISSSDDEDDGPPRKRRAVEVSRDSGQRTPVVQVKPVSVSVDLTIDPSPKGTPRRPPNNGMTSEEEVERAALLIASEPSTPGPSTPNGSTSQPDNAFTYPAGSSGTILSTDSQSASTSRNLPARPHSLQSTALVTPDSSGRSTPRGPKALVQRTANGSVSNSKQQQVEDRKADLKREKRRAKKAKQRAAQREFEERAVSEAQKNERMRAFPALEEASSRAGPSRRDYDEPRHRRFSPPREPAELFFFDDTPGPVPSDLHPPAPLPQSPPPPLPHTPPEQEQEADPLDGLLLPLHVHVVRAASPEEAKDEDEDSKDEEEEEEEEAAIVEILPSGRKTAPTRYYQGDAGDPSLVCVHCNEKGHTARDCPHVVCFSCGAIDEHDTRKCPIGQLCFNCAKRGHYAMDCPEPRRGRGTGACETCGAPGHRAMNCPTIWRIYTYMTPEEKAKRDAQGAASDGLSILEGGTIECGEGVWCCRCASQGHWADDCKDYPAFRDPTAFGMFNALTGPFAASSVIAHDFRDSYNWDAKEDYAYYPEPVLDGVGRMGREKEKAKLKGKEREYEDQADEDDWFSRNREGRDAGRPLKGVGDTVRELDPDKDRGYRRDDQRNKPSLLQRMDLPPKPPPQAPYASRERDRYRDRDRDRDRRYVEPAGRRNGRSGDDRSYRPSPSREYADKNRQRDDDDDYYGPSRGGGGKGGKGRSGDGQKYFGGYSR